MTTAQRIAVVCAALTLVVATSAAALAEGIGCAIGRNLSVGASGEDVRMLQRLLNANPTTRVAAEGPGSPGNETAYFGPMTKTAVAKFQELYTKEVLLPAGLTRGTGFVGALTRARLSALCASLPPVSGALPRPAVPPSMPPSPPPPPTPLPPPPPSATPPTSVYTGKPVLGIPSSYTGHRGAVIKVFGYGFLGSGAEQAHFGAFTISDTALDGSGKLVFTIPALAPRGMHDFWISNEHGESNKTFFVVTDPAVPGPKVERITPAKGKLGTTITVTGSGFLATNTVFAGYGPIRGVPSSGGTTLSFTLTPPIQGGGIVPERYLSGAPFWIYVVNDNGMSTPAIFTIE